MPKRVRVTWRHKGGVKPPNVVYVGRPSRWGNMFKVGVHGDAAECVRLYRKMVAESSSVYWTMIRMGVGELKGKDLACWCKDGPCHADVLLELANRSEVTP